MLLEDPGERGQDIGSFRLCPAPQARDEDEGVGTLATGQTDAPCPDHLSRLANDLGLWKSHQTWYPKYVKSDWARYSWTNAQLCNDVPVARED